MYKRALKVVDRPEVVPRAALGVLRVTNDPGQVSVASSAGVRTQESSSVARFAGEVSCAAIFEVSSCYGG